MSLSGWGHFPLIDAEVISPASRSELFEGLPSTSFIPRGLGRSYGDSALAPNVLLTRYLDHYIDFDEVNGLLSCEAGISINTILELIVPKGWFMPVTPGTSFVTLGGAVASDVHGKNHHQSGTFSQHVIELELMLGNGEVVKASRVDNADLFFATCGGMGLTGLILLVKIKLKPIPSSKITQVTIKTKSLEESVDQFEMNLSSTYSVAWIDCLARGGHLGRSLIMLGEHADSGGFDFHSEVKLNVPFNMPSVLLNPYSIKAFNSLYYGKVVQARSKQNMSIPSYFYPLDSIGSWNRLYGKGGFIQYQFVIPKDAGVSGLRSILNVIADSGLGSFLAVLKTFGTKNKNYLSFPIEGYTLALDFKMDVQVIILAKRLDEMVLGMGGRVYLTKDALLDEVTFKAMYPMWQDFEAVREKYRAFGKFASNQSRRLGLQ